MKNNIDYVQWRCTQASYKKLCKFLEVEQLYVYKELLNPNTLVFEEHFIEPYNYVIKDKFNIKVLTKKEFKKHAIQNNI